jgi:hypothetical protein
MHAGLDEVFGKVVLVAVKVFAVVADPLACPDLFIR